MSDRSYTKEQEIIVERILKNQSHEYYKILEIEKTCNENEVKKAYRKLSLKVHPDKNSHPKADEAFKKVAKAFEVLGDAQKRTIYDQTGQDPDSRGGMPSSSASSGFARGGQQNHPFFNTNANGPFGFGDGVPPGFQGFQFGNDDLFDILFGGGAGVNTFSFGGPGGFTFQTNGFPPRGGAGGAAYQRQRQRARQQEQQQRQRQQQDVNTDFYSALRSYLPMILVLLIPLISNLFAEPQEQFQLGPRPPFTEVRTTSRLHIPYYITKNTKEHLTKKKITQLEKDAETRYVSSLRDSCRRETNYKDQKINDAYGWIFPDQEKLAKAEAIRLPSCEKLTQIGSNLL